MKDGYKIIKEEFDTITGKTVVSINTDYGVFTGEVKLDDIDAKYPSIYHSHELALSKALRKYAKQMMLIIREKIVVLKGIIAQFPNCANPQPGSHEAQLVRKALEKAEDDFSLWKKRVQAIDKNITGRIAARDQIVKKYIEKDSADKTN